MTRAAYSPCGWNGRGIVRLHCGRRVPTIVPGLSLGLGALAWFRRRFNSARVAARWLAQHSFAVYLLHAPVLVALTPLLRPLPGGPFLKVPLLTALGLAASFAAAWLARRLPGLRRIL